MRERAGLMNGEIEIIEIARERVAKERGRTPSSAGSGVLIRVTVPLAAEASHATT